MIVIVGAGITGLSVANMLLDEGVEFVMLEKNYRAGGLAKTVATPHGPIDEYGAHIFNTNSERIRNFVFSFLPQDNWIKFKRRAQIFIDGKYYDYPLEKHLPFWWWIKQPLSACIAQAGLSAVAQAGLFSHEALEGSFARYLEKRFGKFLCEKYYYPFNWKKWNISLSDIEAKEVVAKIPRPGADTIHSNFWHPRGGMGKLTESMYERVKNFVELGKEVIDFEKHNGYVLLEAINNIKWKADKVIWTAPASLLKVEGLYWHGTTTVVCKTTKVKDYSWLYIADEACPYHKISNYSYFAPETEGIEIFDVTGKDANIYENEIFRRFMPVSYPIPVIGDSRNFVRDEFPKHGIYPAGRFGSWRYMTMDDCIIDAERVLKDVL